MSKTPPATDLPPQFDPASVETTLYKEWLDADLFTADAKRSRRTGGDRDPFVVVMPPPNVTAVLHMGHGLNITVQDVLIRWRRMCGDEALWLPGTDHAGIATQNVIERQLAAEGKTRFDLGREAFVKRTSDFVTETGGTILEQLRAVGASCDWTRTAYTLSPELSRAVREAFVLLYERGLIYRGHRVIHWCSRCLTSLSDEEAEHSEETGNLYHLRYPLTDDPTKGITIATTRPETMLADVAVAVHPDDERYRHLIGRTVTLPIANVAIPIIADSIGVDPEFGTGAVKITPAHDANDFEMGSRHKLPMPVVLSPEGTMANGADAGSRVPPELLGIDRFEARQRIVQMLKHLGALEKIESHSHAVRHCYRCDTVVEPRLSDQWFVKMKPLAEPALEAVRDRRIRILPERWEAVYVNWLENIRDWNISRQLWWGHRIPVWYCDACGEVTVSRDDISKCVKCGQPARQDEDVLDTWFSSWLWPFSTLGWPNAEAGDLAAFYPTDDLITAPEILFFWVARMVMGGYAFMGETPFHTVYLHGTVRDMKHLKMSKSLGNGIDPLDVRALYGTDALRYTVIAGLGIGADVMLDPNDLEKSFAPGRNFVTKLWNIGRFLLTNVGSESVQPLDRVDATKLRQSDRWILNALNTAIAECDAALGPSSPKDGVWDQAELRSGLRLSEYTESARRFVWNELADWYLESTKGRLASHDGDGEVARAVLAHSFDAALRLLQPIVPFITDTLWRRLPIADEGARGEFIARAVWPTQNPAFGAEPGFELVREAINAIRQLRADYAIPPGDRIHASLDTGAAGRNATRDAAIFAEESEFIERVARCTVDVEADETGGSGATILLSSGSRIRVPLAGVIDIEKECRKAKEELEKLDSQLAALNGRLANPGFTDRAPAQVVDAEHARQVEWTARRGQLADKVASLCGS
ncbi:MAG: valine--tRNA ligase [Gemmatimonadaceae bacterium]|nr:valine--tRNA ligase [Gemmatimonadaceae bacterium]